MKYRLLSLVTLACALTVYANATPEDNASDQPILYPDQLLWGDTHLHSSWSADAYGFGTTQLSPEDAFRFAQGEQLKLPGGLSARLTRPLDFLVVSDHAEFLGVMPAVAAGAPQFAKTKAGRRWFEYIQRGDLERLFAEYREALLGDNPDPFDEALHKTLWERAVNTADKMNRPGQFSAFAGYEWTSMPGGSSLHRVVIFADAADRVTRTRPFTSMQSHNPERLWQSLRGYEQLTGGRVLAIPHSGNLSNGRMFAPARLNGEGFTPEYARKRAYWEPLYEVTQVKGDSETHPALSVDDPYADYETWDATINDRPLPDVQLLQYEYARSALALGLEIHSQLGANPFKFGLQAGTDSHTGLSTAEESNFFGKFPDSFPGPDRISNRMGGNRLEAEAVSNWRP